MKHSRINSDWGGALRRAEAARYCGHSPGHFDKLVKNGIYPPGRNADGVALWLRWELENALAELPTVSGDDWETGNSCDEVFQ
jgi:hypothetical protein